jgi:hypothetical protein
MSNRTFTLFTIFIGLVCAYAIISAFFFGRPKSVRNDVIQGVLVGGGLALVTAQGYGRIKSTRVNGWTTMFGCGRPGNGLLMQAACALVFAGPVNLPEEAMYWKTAVDGSGHTLDGQHHYRLHFPAGGLPPNNAFWSLTMGNAKNRFVDNALNRYSLGDRSGLVPNADGTVDIYLQNTSPAVQAANWLPAPAGPFTLWLRVYLPGPAILAGNYAPPPLVKVP